MNPLTNMKNVLKLSERDLQRGGKSSWHDMYRGSAWIFVGGMPFDLTEGDIIAVFSQYGEIVNINLVRDKASGKSKGFCFICYEDQRSTILAVDNLNGIKILNRSLRVDHVADYKPPKDNEKTDEETRRLYMEGCAPRPQIAEENIKREGNGSVQRPVKVESDGIRMKKEKKAKKEKKPKKEKKEKKSKKKKKKKKIESSSSEESSSDDDSSSESEESEVETKRNKHRSKSPQRRRPEATRSGDRDRNENRKERRRSRSRSRDNERRKRSRSR